MAIGCINAATGIAIVGVVPTLIARDGGLGWAGKRPVCCRADGLFRKWLGRPGFRA